MSIFSDLIANETLSAVRVKIIGYAQAADIQITNWIEGSVGEQTIETFTQASYATALIISSAIRGFASLDTSTDPGDPDAYNDTNEDLDDEPGLLSAHGENTFGTPRIEATFATGFVTFDNTAGTVARVLAPEALTFTWTGGSPPSPAPTYRNSPDAAIYTEPGDVVTVAAGATLVIPVEAEEIGTRSNAPSTTLSLTTTLAGATATNAAPLAGTDRESAVDYRARCREAPARVSLGGPAAAYSYLAKTQLNGDPLTNASGNAVNINRTQVTQDSATGIVDAFFAAPSGVPTGEDVTAANANIESEAFAVPDAITYTGAAAVAVPITVVGTFKLSTGITADAKQAIVDALTEAFKVIPIGGLDQVLGAGVVYTEDIQRDAANSYTGLYNVLVTTPAGATTALALGEVATLTTTVGDWTEL
jgi:hypothetical protein